jgi:hypothetical protein
VDQNKQKSTGRWKLLLVLSVCAAPLVFSYFTYYVIKPEGRNNYGALIDPRAHPIPVLGATTLDGKPAALESFQGKWILLQTGSGECPAACQRKLLEMRQLRLMQGKEMERVERVWLITDQQPIDTVLMRQYDGTTLLRVNPAVLKAWLPVEAGTSADEHLYMIDPLGHLMMRFPKDADPGKVKKDIYKLLKASSIG